jgi:hypothetical protein
MRRGGPGLHSFLKNMPAYEKPDQHDDPERDN